MGAGEGAGEMGDFEEFVRRMKNAHIGGVALELGEEATRLSARSEILKCQVLCVCARARARMCVSVFLCVCARVRACVRARVILGFWCVGCEK